MPRERAGSVVPQVREYFRRKHIRGAIFDLDDFLLDTNRDAFGRQMDVFSRQVVSLERDIPFAFMRGVVHDANRQIHQEMGVDPRRWERIVHSLGDTLGRRMRPILRQFTPTLLAIYKTIPSPMPRALRTVSIIHEAVPVAINSHALGPWTGDKLFFTGLLKHMSHVHVVPVAQKHKEARDWVAAARGLGLRPRDVMTGGDSLIADTMPALEAGVREGNVFLAESDWGKHNSNGKSAITGILRADGIAGLIPLMLQEVER